MAAQDVIIEPFRIKATEPIPFLTEQERAHALREARYNVFLLAADRVTIDLLTDSGTGAMSQSQWAALQEGDESYAGSRSWHRFAGVVRRITGMDEVIPTHQGRAAEHLLFSETVREGQVVPNSTHFDTTRANVEHRGGIALDLPCAEGLDPVSPHPFKGNMDLERLEQALDRRDCALVIVTLTNNRLGGQPVALDNLGAVRQLCRKAGVPLFLDAARFAENVALVRARDPSLAGIEPRRIARRFFDLADGCFMSAKKDGLVNIGGFLALRDRDLAERIRQQLILTEGFPTYGGLAGRDLSAMAVGLDEALDANYLEYRLASVDYLHRRLVAHGVPVWHPAGGHAVYLDADRFLPSVPRSRFPGQSLVCAIYLRGGVRSVEVGTVMMGEDSPTELVRLAIPRRTYTQSQFDYVVEVVADVWRHRDAIGGMRLLHAPPVLRHFSAAFEPLHPAPLGNQVQGSPKRD